MSGSDKPRTVKLLCPSLSKIVAFAAWDHDKLDLGSVARAFGLDPSTLKLNGHFISRGVDLISSSVTWRSLLNFFSTKGLSTGKDDNDALVVTGKHSKSGTKRGHDLQDAEPQGVGVGRKAQPQDINLLMDNKKLRGINSGRRHSLCGCSGYEDVHQESECQGIGLKRKQLLKDVSLLKKLKINEANSEVERGDELQSIVSSRKLNCSYTSGNMKRMREDELILAGPCKRYR